MSAKKRDYKAEYKKFQSSTKAKKYRAELNKYNRKKGTYGNGDGKDASHKGGKIVGFESQSKNRGRAEKSRLKKESPDFNPMIDNILDEVIDEYQVNEGTNQMIQVYKDLDKKFKKYDHTGIRDFGKVSKYLKTKFSKGSSLPDTIASFYNDYRGGEDMKKNIAKLTKYAKKMGGYKKESVDEARGTCWVGYQQKGMKDKGGKKVPNCVKEVYDIYWENNLGESCGYTFEFDKENDLNEAEYQGRKVKLGKPMQGDTKKFKVYVKNPKGNVVKVNFGQGGGAKGGTMKIRKSNPKARKSFRARHNCDNPGPRHKARYWSCRKW